MLPRLFSRQHLLYIVQTTYPKPREDIKKKIFLRLLPLGQQLPTNQNNTLHKVNLQNPIFKYVITLGVRMYILCNT